MEEEQGFEELLKLLSDSQSRNLEFETPQSQTNRINQRTHKTNEIKVKQRKPPHSLHATTQ